MPALPGLDPEVSEMSDYDPLRIHVEKFIGKREALEALLSKLLLPLNECRTNRFQFKCSIVELPPLKPIQKTLEAA